MAKAKNSLHYQKLRDKWVKRHRESVESLWLNHRGTLEWISAKFPTKYLLTGALSALIMLSSPNLPHISLPHVLAQSINKHTVGRKEELIIELSNALPAIMRPLTAEENLKISTILSNSFNFKLVPQLDGISLNRTYGLIGAEQHLYRYPGDTLADHLETPGEQAMFGPSGIAPGLGAWGYFADSKSDFTSLDKAREKYYIAVQTFLAPGFNNNVAKYRDFFKYRKMLVVNPKTGQAVICDIADAGPSLWTGKHLGGSPEVMDLLGLGTGPRKGAVLYFFVDDTGDKIPLGPIKL